MKPLDKQDPRWEELADVIDGMRVPILRRTDLRWLQGNLGIQNWRHPRYPYAVGLINDMIKAGADKR